MMLRGVCFEVVYWPGAAADGGSWKQVGCICGSIVTSSGIWFYYVVEFSFLFWYLNLYRLKLTLKLIINKIIHNIHCNKRTIINDNSSEICDSHATYFGAQWPSSPRLLTLETAVVANCRIDVQV